MRKLLRGHRWLGPLLLGAILCMQVVVGYHAVTEEGATLAERVFLFLFDLFLQVGMVATMLWIASYWPRLGAALFILTVLIIQGDALAVYASFHQPLLLALTVVATGLYLAAGVILFRAKRTAARVTIPPVRR